MKTEDMIQLGALAAIGFLIYQKFAGSKVPAPTGPGASSIQPSQQTQVDFGVNNPTDTSWGDNSIPADFGLQSVVDGVIWG